MDPARPFGVYVHIPFCSSRCDYCAFATWTDRFHLVDAYVDACATEASRRLREAPPATSVFFGGGTPSLLDPGRLGRILDAVPAAPGAEVTVECNPDSVDRAKLLGYRAAGVNRLSFGVQAMAPHVLAGLGRHHSPAAAAAAVAAAAEAGFGDSYSVDLIFGGAGESLHDWEATVDAVLALDPPPRHISAYALTVEAGTPLAADHLRHPDPDDQADKYMLADRRFAAAGLSWYEISNWAVPGAECRHNQLYWRQGEYAGIGAAAHSHRVDPANGESRRWWNVRTPERYVKRVNEGRHAESAGERLGVAARRAEGMELRLRTRDGFPRDSLPGWADDPDLVSLVEPAPGERLVLTPRGRLLANEIAVRLV